MNQFYQAKKTGTTERGSFYSILQDGPASFHMTVQNGMIMYQHFQDPASIEELEKNILLLESELLDKKEAQLLTSAEEPVILQDAEPVVDEQPTEQSQGDSNGI